MKLLFVCNNPVRFTAETPQHEPLGGTESATAWLARQLAGCGHDITLLTWLPPGTPEYLAGVRHADLAPGSPDIFAGADFDAVIAAGMPGAAEALAVAAPRALQVGWMHLLPGQPDMASLPQMSAFMDCAVFVSQTQRAAAQFSCPSQVIGNGIAPGFENMFESAADLAAAKKDRAVYTSIPDRGLDVLAEAFALARIRTKLDVYSGMRLYQKDDGELASLYARIDAMPRCRHHDAVSQGELPAALRSAAFLAYPGTLPESWCNVAVEALAAGMKVVGTAIGALPESTRGYADLLPVPAGTDRTGLAALYAPFLERSVADYLARPGPWAEERFAQSQAISRDCSWAARAKEWENFLGPAIAWKRSQ
jgi:glycosyltransferase involved in cell wall biosynthesis